MSKRADHVVMLNGGGGFRCLHCFAKQDMAFPCDNFERHTTVEEKQMNHRRLRKRFGKEPAQPRRSAVQFWRDEFTNNPTANAVRVKFLPRFKGRKIIPFARWEPYEMSVVRVRNCKGKRT